MMPLRFSSTARSRIASISASWRSTLRPGLDGQSMLATVATQAPRNSRGGGGGRTAAGFRQQAAQSPFIEQPDRQPSNTAAEQRVGSARILKANCQNGRRNAIGISAGG